MLTIMIRDTSNASNVTSPTLNTLHARTPFPSASPSDACVSKRPSWAPSLLVCCLCSLPLLNFFHFIRVSKVNINLLPLAFTGSTKIFDLRVCISESVGPSIAGWASCRRNNRRVFRPSCLGYYRCSVVLPNPPSHTQRSCW